MLHHFCSKFFEANKRKRSQRSACGIKEQVTPVGGATWKMHLMPLINGTYANRGKKRKNNHRAPAHAAGATNADRQHGKHGSVDKFVPGHLDQAHSDGLCPANKETEHQRCGQQQRHYSESALDPNQ